MTILSKDTNLPVYIFGYDWRKSCRDSGKKLKDFVVALQKKLAKDNVTKFNFLTHSMGGLVFECFLKELKNDPKNDFSQINRAVITVCPFRGLPKVLHALVVGEGGLEFPLFVSKDRFRRIVRTFPSAYELLPYYEGAFKTAGGAPFLLYDLDQWQSNLTKEPPQKELLEIRLAELQIFREGDPTSLEPARLEPARLELEKLPEEVRERILVIAGNKVKTLIQVKVEEDNDQRKAKNFFNFEADGSSSEDGDGTVPLVSAIAYKNSILTLAVKRKGDLAPHAFFLNDGQVQNIIHMFFSEDDEGKNKVFDKKDDWWNDISGSIEKM